LIFDEVNALDPKKNPAYEFCESKLWMAYKDGKAVGGLQVSSIIRPIRYGTSRMLALDG
jgi:hypothetical protein